MRCRSWTRASASQSVVYCADTSNEGHLGNPERVLENVNMLAESAKSSRKPYYLMSTRPGVMNLRQAKALREAGLVQIGGARQGLGAIDRVGRYMMERRPLRNSTGRAGARLADLLAARAFSEKACPGLDRGHRFSAENATI